MVRKYYILGAGITGLVLGYELLKKGCEVIIIEKDKKAGGLAKTLIWNDIPLDLGPHIYHTPDKEIENYWKDEFGDLFYERVHWSKNFKDGVYYDYPISYELIDSFPGEIKKNINSELNQDRHDDLIKAKNYYDYMKALVGETLQEMFFIKYPEKLWGMSTQQLDANWAPKRISLREKSSPFFGTQWSAVGINGSGSIVNKLCENILNQEGTIFLNEEVENLVIKDNEIMAIKTKNKEFILNKSDIVINTTSYTRISRLINHKTELKYRGIILVFLHVKVKKAFPENVDFIYFDDPEILFHRVSEQSQFIQKTLNNENIYICEIAYSQGDNKDQLSEEIITNNVISQFVSLGYIKNEDIIGTMIKKIPEVYPMFFINYQDSLAKTKAAVDSISNMYNLGSLAEYEYSDLQVLFGKAIDLAEVLTDKTIRINKIDKSNARLNFNKTVKIGNREVGEDYPAFIIAEIGLNHNGSIELCKKLIDEAIDAGVDAVKLQSYKSEKRVAKDGKTAKYVEKVLGIEETDYEMFKKNELTFEETKDIINYARDRVLIFSAPFDEESLEELEEIQISCYKIASFDLNNLPLIKKIAETGKPIILSTGMANLSDIEDALKTIISTGNKDVVLLHCTSAYPCPASDMNIKAIDTMQNAFKLPVGLSDHYIGETISLAAVARGASIIEKHFTLDKKMEGPDHVLSLEPQELRSMVKNIRTIEQSLGTGIKQPSLNEFSNIIRFRKTLYAAEKIKKGTKISLDKIALKGPAYGIYPKYLDIVVNQVAQVDIEKDTPIKWEHIM